MDYPTPDVQREALFDAPCHVIDILPRQVPPESGSRYFRAEDYLLEHPRIDGLFRRFFRLCLKLGCYYALLVNSLPEEEWIPEPEPERLSALFETCIAGEPRGCLHLLFPEENVLITADGGDLCLSLYNASGEFLATAAALAASEGLFLRKAAD